MFGRSEFMRCEASMHMGHGVVDSSALIFSIVWIFIHSYEWRAHFKLYSDFSISHLFFERLARRHRCHRMDRQKLSKRIFFPILQLCSALPTTDRKSGDTTYHTRTAYTANRHRDFIYFPNNCRCQHALQSTPRTWRRNMRCALHIMQWC